VSRHPQKVDADNSLLAADLTDAKQADMAVKDSEIAYLTVGLPYKRKTWEATWPVIMQNVIEACLKHDTKLVFFDNIYMYDGQNLNPMKEDHPINPPSKKGQVRAGISCMLMDHVQNSGLKALIARSADFYGTGTDGVSILTETVFKPLKAGKKANWLGRADRKHSFTYTPDAAKATALLGNTAKAYGEVWHLPTAKAPFTGKEWVEQIAEALQTEARYRVAGKGIVRTLGIFHGIMRETVEMLYQYEQDYVFDSTKFETAFGMSPTPYREGIREVVELEFR
jgi:nucleoside-diphosphate-sugar epimerase